MGLSEGLLAAISDGRTKPRIPTAVSLQAALAMFWARLGRLSAMEAPSAARFWRRWVGRELCSVDTIGRVQAVVNCPQIRCALHRVYERLKRNQARPLNLGRDVAVLDGHDSHPSYRRH